MSTRRPSPDVRGPTGKYRPTSRHVKSPLDETFSDTDAGPNCRSLLRGRRRSGVDGGRDEDGSIPLGEPCEGATSARVREPTTVTRVRPVNRVPEERNTIKQP